MGYMVIKKLKRPKAIKTIGNPLPLQKNPFIRKKTLKK